MKRALFAGTFDPFTIGHQDIVERALALFDEVVIGVGVNYTKAPMFPLEERLQALQSLYRNEPRVRVATYSGLTIDFAHEMGIDVLVRGVRTISDFQYEQQIADANRAMAGIETVVLYTRPELGYISSTLVRDLKSHGKDVSAFLPN